jgi:benzoyl-CoA reductase/2-hydroxyglutaryl-CoA dehydratase subunit BcrC/BadD/HgdB
VGISKVLESKATETLLRFPLTYELIGGVGKRWYGHSGKRSLGLWLDFIASSMKRGFSRDKPVVWSNVFTPCELLHGLDLIPIYPETLAALASSLNVSRNAISAAETGLYSSDICSFYRCCMGLVMKGYLPKPDLVISNSQLCEGSVKFFHNVSRLYRCDHYLLDVPYYSDKGAKNYLIGQLEEVAGRVAAKQGKNISFENLFNALELSNKAREYMDKVDELRRASPCPLSGNDAIGYVLNMKFSALGTESGVNFFNTLYEELKEKVDNGVVRDERFRMLWLHHVRPYYPSGIIDYLQENGAAVCSDEANHIHWEPFDPQKPFEGLASKMISNPSSGPLSRRSGLALKLVEKYSVDGVIHFSHWGCRQSCGGAHIIRETMLEKGIPMLILNGDGANRDDYAEGQTKTRLQAFIEMLEARE